MPATRAAAPSPWVAVFDLDGTLTWRDTLLPYLLGYAARRPGRLLGLWRMPFALIGYLAWHRDRGVLKSQFIRALMGGDARPDIDRWSADYVSRLDRRRAYRPAALAVLEAHRAAGDRLILLSASPDLYVPLIGRRLGFERTLCTEVQWRENPPVDRLDGTLRGPNRRGAEKVALPRLAAGAVSGNARGGLRKQRLRPAPPRPSGPCAVGQRQRPRPPPGRCRGNRRRGLGLRPRRTPGISAPRGAAIRAS